MKRLYVGGEEIGISAVYEVDKVSGILGNFVVPDALDGRYNIFIPEHD